VDKEAKVGNGANKTTASKGTKKAKATRRKAKPKHDISGFQVSVYSTYCALPGGISLTLYPAA
jgi:hypothetical protein